MFITRKKMKKKITDNEVKGGNTDVIDLCKRIMSEKEVFNT